ncbi:MAG: hypothetical protein CSA89_00400 [Bacteroidales bacterium]|nr:MAG: hypothetical protein CSA89_00400 [Bacteroidales bacterium]
MRDIIVSIALKLGLYHLLVDIATAYNQRKLAKAFHRYGLETIIQADEALRSVGVNMFFAFGTLLGSHREKDFIAHDCDLDVGLLYEDRPENIDEVMARFGFKKKRQFYVKQTGLITEEQYEYKGVQIDIFYYFVAEDDKMFCYGARRHEHKEWKEANASDGFPSVLWYCPKTDFVEREFKGHLFWSPRNIEGWLTSLYGQNYMTPIRNWTDQDSKTDIVYHTERLYRR